MERRRGIETMTRRTGHSLLIITLGKKSLTRKIMTTGRSTAGFLTIAVFVAFFVINSTAIPLEVRQRREHDRSYYDAIAVITGCHDPSCYKADWQQRTVMLPHPGDAKVNYDKPQCCVYCAWYCKCCYA